MKYLFIHNNFPGQFRHIAALLGERPENEVAAIGSQTAKALRGVQLQKYSLREAGNAHTHAFARRFELDCQRAEQVMYSATALARKGFKPNIIVGHTGWGEMLPIREVFPRARVVGYGEFYYRSEGQDAGFDAEFPAPTRDSLVGMHIKNAAAVTSLLDCDTVITPTIWQRSTFPVELQSKCQVVHEGVRTDLAVPKPDAVVKVGDGIELRPGDEVVTFVARNLEPTRGYHVFMRALPVLMRKRPNAQILIVGGSGTSYGAPPPPGTTWQSRYFDEVKHDIDVSRVHFLGQLPYARYLSVLQVSAVHVYLTYPFVLSWSMLEAMSAQCVVVGSDTAPVSEIIRDGENGLLVPFFSTSGLAERIIEVLRAPDAHIDIRRRARETVVERYDARNQALNLYDVLSA